MQTTIFLNLTKFFFKFSKSKKKQAKQSVKQVNQEILLDKPAIYGFFENNCTLESNKSVIQSLTW